MNLRYICNNEKCRFESCERHPTGQDEHIPRIDLCGSSQCLIWCVEDDGDMTIHPPLKR